MSRKRPHGECDRPEDLSLRPKKRAFQGYIEDTDTRVSTPSKPSTSQRPLASEDSGTRQAVLNVAVNPIDNPSDQAEGKESGLLFTIISFIYYYVISLAAVAFAWHIHIWKAWFTRATFDQAPQTSPRPAQEGQRHRKWVGTYRLYGRHAFCSSRRTKDQSRLLFSKHERRQRIQKNGRVSKATLNRRSLSPKPRPQVAITKPSATAHEASIFSLFPKLPIELRVEIWRLALPPPRVIEIDCCLRGQSFDSLIFSPMESRSQASGLLRANLESRAVFLEHYKLLCNQGKSARNATDTATCESRHWSSSSPVVYINYDIDTLYIGPSSENGVLVAFHVMHDHGMEKHLSRVRSLAVTASNHVCFSFGVEMAQVPQLQELIIVLGEQQQPCQPTPGSWIRPRGAVRFAEAINTTDDVSNNWSYDSYKTRVASITESPNITVNVRQVTRGDPPQNSRWRVN
ncbi:uncharacterized protein LY89DRAFT_678167 [Mollisia scopiformis]|uniref:2EXR domain-containing protein n=1 Tax=Mollisia scopiformis TaxID=149040 RepID=A0A132B479_MOLSC|nr:uncharacterized protein LY89DRAFT_678167 [Mollisia scopiformis]KUJ07202.1 hypothetical protein LY89DRAFT_678167 [Mollisia scopiformis]